MQAYYGLEDWYERLAPPAREEMTLTYAVIADGAIILAADSQITNEHTVDSRVIAAYESTRGKIKRLACGGAFSIAGNSAFADALLEKARVAKADKEESFDSTVITHAMLFEAENQRLHGRRSLPLRPHVDFLFCGYTGPRAESVPQIVKLSSQREFGYNHVATGSGYGFSGASEHGAARYLHHRFYRADMSLEQAKLLAYIIVAEVADLDNSVGGPIEMSIITKSGAEPFTDLGHYESRRQSLIQQVRALLG